MNDSIEVELKKAVKTAMFDCEVESNLALRPSLLTNDYETGKKVLSDIVSALATCEEFIFSVAFITLGGLMPLLETLKELERKKVKGKILTTDYLNFSEPKALKKLLEFSNLSLRVYKDNFHTKGYIFKNGDYYKMIVGSSNLTQTALAKNKEWNLQISSMENGELIKNSLEDFNQMWKKSENLNLEWIKTYEEIYRKQKEIAKKENVPNIIQYKLKPNKMQVEAVKSLKKLREKKEKKAILISATGTGKTYLSAFDVREFSPKKMLFLVHREQILKQSESSFKIVLGSDIKSGILSGSKKDYEADYLFSTIQTMSKDENLEYFKPEYFDYIIIDEVHRLGGDSYQKVLKYFKPKFILGMTATPERTDGFDIYGLFDNNIAYEIRLQEALEEDLLCPFHYFGITDLEINNEIVDDKTKFNRLLLKERVNYIVDQIRFYGYSGNRAKGLIFCSRKEEAKELSNIFNMEYGFHTVALSGDDSQESRENAIQRLEQNEKEGSLDYIFTVDIFNEGVDIPAINQIIMLRPTKSAIIFVQQLGRGLRKDIDKEFVVIIDFIGNYTKNFLIPIALSGDRTFNKDTIRKYVSGGNRIIPGCSTVNFDKISKERIYESINSTKFSNEKLLKEEYNNLKSKIGRIPKSMDFYKNGAIDPSVILEKKKSYYNFLKDTDKEYKGVLTEEESKMLEFATALFSNGKRPHELLIIRLLLMNKTVNEIEIMNELEKEYGIVDDEYSVNNAIKILQGDFINKNDEKKYGSYSILDKDRIINANTRYVCYYNKIQNMNNEFNLLLEDLVEYGLTIYKEKYSKRYLNTNLSLNQKYSRKEVCRLLNWEKDLASVMYGYYIKKGTCPVFVTYNKNENISSSIKYKDKFISENVLSWMTKSGVNLESKVVKEILEYRTNNLKIHLFIKKADAEGTEFYYLGRVEPILNMVKECKMENDKGKELSVVNIPLKLETRVQEDIYQYLIN